MEKADSNVALGRYDVALEMYNTYIESHMEDADARIKRAHVNLVLKRYTDVLQDATRALRYTQNTSEPLYLRGMTSFWLHENGLKNCKKYSLRMGK